MEDLEEKNELDYPEKYPKTDTFKKPQLCLVGPRKGKRSKVRIVDCQYEPKLKEETEILEATEETSTRQEQIVEPTEVNVKSSEQSSQLKLEQSASQEAPAQKLKESPVPYLEPKWGGVPITDYSLDVIKSGTVLKPIDLNSKSYYVFGRQTNCDIQMAHPTISRYHAVLQFSKGTDDKPQGFYLYDLGSTHGTFLNKSRVRPKMFIRIKVGHLIKLGGSSRLYSLQGPTDDMEAESDLTVTELKAKRRLEVQAKELAEISRKQKEEDALRKREEDGVDWGMGDDADEESDLSENPYAITTNEELYIDDPKKTLRGWFEREGYELEYDVEEKGPGQFLCRIEVPVEGARGGCMVAEALVKGKKKEAVVQSALEACRLLDRLGLLRQATHESRKRKAKNWEEDDFYDSDEDTFLDRTGAVEKKRQQRMMQAGRGEDHIENYTSLSEKHCELLKKLEETRAQLQKAQLDLAASTAKQDEESDPLDSFMNTLSKVGSTDKKLISKLKVDLAALQKEEVQLRKLVNIARPASLPPLVAPVSETSSSSIKDTTLLKNKLMLAARMKTNQKQKMALTTSKEDLNFVLEGPNDQEEVEDEESFTREGENSSKLAQEVTSDVNIELNKSPSVGSKCEKNAGKEAVPLIGPSKPAINLSRSLMQEADKSPEDVLRRDNDCDMDDDDDDDERTIKDAEKRKKKNRRRTLLRTEKALERNKAHYDTSDPNYSVWVPPEDQTGDGTTKLNAKLGY